MTAPKLEALALRCEQVSGPDRELDDAIASELFTGKHRVCIQGLSDEAGGMWMFQYPNGSVGSSLRFSASIDAARTLVPDGWSVLAINERTEWEIAEALKTSTDPAEAARWSAVLRVNTEDRSYRLKRSQLRQGCAATPALALAAAALRALARSPQP